MRGFMGSLDLRFRTRIGTLNHSPVGSSRRKEALISFRPRSLSLLTSAATEGRFMESLDLRFRTRIGTLNHSPRW
jgi:hypothetical protein